MPAVVPLPIPALAVLVSAFDAPQRLWVEIALASPVDVGRWAVHRRWRGEQVTDCSSDPLDRGQGGRNDGHRTSLHNAEWRSSIFERRHVGVKPTHLLRLTATSALVPGSRTDAEFRDGIAYIVSGLKTLVETGSPLVAA
jgi:hypothetical protein